MATQTNGNTMKLNGVNLKKCLAEKFDSIISCRVNQAKKQITVVTATRDAEKLDEIYEYTALITKWHLITIWGGSSL